MVTINHPITKYCGMLQEFEACNQAFTQLKDEGKYTNAYAPEAYLLAMRMESLLESFKEYSFCYVNQDEYIHFLKERIDKIYKSQVGASKKVVFCCFRKANTL